MVRATVVICKDSLEGGGREDKKLSTGGQLVKLKMQREIS
jgi:hypothetical protein